MHSTVWDAPRLREILDAILAATGMNGRALARLGGFGESQVGRWRDGKTRPSWDVISKLGASLVHEYPDLAALAQDLIRAAGYPGAVEDPRPGIVRGHWDDENVRAMWRLKVTPDQKLTLIEAYLRDAPGDDGEMTLTR